MTLPKLCVWLYFYLNIYFGKKLLKKRRIYLYYKYIDCRPSKIGIRGGIRIFCIYHGNKCTYSDRLLDWTIL